MGRRGDIPSALYIFSGVKFEGTLKMEVLRLVWVAAETFFAYVGKEAVNKACGTKIRKEIKC